MKAQLIAREWISKDTFSILLELEAPLNAKPGQFVLVLPKDHPQRAYSIVEERGNTIRLGIKVQKDTSTYFSTVPLMTEITVLGPFGSFIPREANSVTIIGGGIGVTPLVSLYKYFKAKKVPTTVLLCARGPMPFVEYFDTPKVFDTLTGTRISIGDVPKGSDVYICGPLPMIEAFRNELIQNGWDENHIYSEEFT